MVDAASPHLLVRLRSGWSSFAEADDRSDENFEGRRMPEKCVRAGCESVSTRLEHDDQITLFGPSQLHLVGQKVKRGTKGTDHGSDLARRATHAVADRNRVVLANHLAKVARSGQ